MIKKLYFCKKFAWWQFFWYFLFLKEKGTFAEDGPCNMEDGSGPGTCIELRKCPMRIEQVKSGKRFSTATGRCGFRGMTEIVCCPNESNSEGRNNHEDSTNNKYTSKIDEKLGLRPATIGIYLLNIYIYLFVTIRNNFK